MRKIIAAIAVWLALCGAAGAQTCSAYPFTFAPNTTIASAQMNSNFATIRNCANSLLAPITSPSFTGPVTITGTPLGVLSGGTGQTTASGVFSVFVAPGGNLTGSINGTVATLASAGTVNIGAAAANYVLITGTTTITAFDTVQQGTTKILEFAGALTLTHNGTSLILPGAANITTAAGDVAIAVSEGSGNWRIANYMKAATGPVGTRTPTQTVETSGTGATYTTPANTSYLRVRMVGGGGGGGAQSTNNGANGTNSTFGSLTAGFGSGGSAGGAGGAGGSASGCTIGISGSTGQTAAANGGTQTGGGQGGASVFGGAGGNPVNANGGNAVGAGSGGSGAGAAASTAVGGGGGAGAYCESEITNPAATFTFTVGAAGNGGAAGGLAGGNGATGLIIIDAFPY